MPTMNDQSSESSQALQNPLVSAEHENIHQNKTQMPKVNANIPQPAMHTQLLESATSSAKAVIDGKGRSATNENMTQSSIRELSATSLSAEGAASGQNPITNVTQMQSTTEIKSVQDQSTHSLPCISPSFLSVGRMVRVERRNIPGEKLKEEANGKITKIHTKEVPISEVMINEGVPVENIDASNIVSTVIAVDVKWVLGGGERKILVEHVTHAPELETNSGNNLRDRNDDSRKRCPFCPSFIKDCQLKCHEYIEYVKQKSMVPEKLPSEKQQAPEEKVERQPRQKKKKKKQRDRKEYLSEHQQLALKGGDMKQLEDDEESLSSMDSEEEEEHAVSVFKRFRRLMGRGENVTLEKLAKQKERQMHKQKQNHKRQWRQPSSSCALGSLPSPTVMGNETTANSTSAKKRKRDSVIASRDNDKSNFDFEADEATDDDVEIINQEDYQEELLTPREGYLVDSDLDDEESGNDGDNMVLRTLGNVDFQGDQDDSSDDSSIEVGIGNEDFETTNNPSPSYSSDDNSNECGKFSADDGAFAGDEDDNFLQGEGHAAAENLPCDITDTTKTLRYGELPQFIDVLALKIDEERIPHAQYQLSLLKGRLSLARREVGSIKSFDELNILFKKSTELREYINIKLTNTGLDQINMPKTRLESKREKRANKDTLTESEKKRCRRSNIELLELRTDELRVRVDEIHQDATMLQREIKELLRSENESLLDARENEEEHVATFVNNGSNPRRMRRKENISEYDWDRHQHASRRRNPSIRATAQKGNVKEYTDQNEYGVSETRPRAENKSNSLKSDIAPDTECRLASESIECNAFLRNQSTNIEFIGDTDDHDDGNGLPELDINAYRRGTSRKRPVIGSRGSGRVSRENRSKSGQNQAFMGAQIINNRRVEQGVKIHGRKTPREATNTAKKQKRQSRLEVSPKGKSSRYSTRDGNTTHRLNTDAPSNIERRQINIASHARDSASDFEGRTLPNPGIPDFLSADGLFESLVHRQENAESPGENMTLHPHDIRSCDELCQLLVDYYPHKLQSCREILRTLSKSVYDMPTEPKNQGVVILQTLLGIFQRKSSTFLDLLQFDPHDACFQIDCWSLVFRLMQMNFHLKLQKEDGAVHTVFSKKEQLADHILLLMIDVVYSQLFWEEWGWTRRVGPEMIDCMCSLRDRIGAVVPLFTKVSALLISKFGRPMWYPSKQSIDQQYYVSAINPDAHRLLLSSGITTRPPTDGSRLSLWSRGMPRKEVEALWSIIGFATNGPISPSAKDFKHSQSLLSAMMYYNRGTLSKVNANDANQLPPSKDHLDRCSKEISWICTLISSKSFGTLPPNDMDKFVMNIIHKAVMLEASIVSLNTLPTVANGIVDDVVIKLWKSSSCNVGFVDSDAISHPNVLDSIFVSNGPNEAWSLTPSTRLLQRCVTLIATYASMIISKKVRWKGFSKLLSSTVAGFEKKAEEFELKPEGSKNENSVTDAFARNFSEDTSTRNSEIVSDGSAFFREIACYLLLGCVMARRNVTVSGVGIALDKRLREQLWLLTSVDEMRKHRNHFLEKTPGNEPPSTRNLSLLFTSAKIMSFTTLLILFVDDYRLTPLEVSERLNKHLSKIGLDDDVSMLEYSVTSIISTLFQSCDILHSLNNKQYRVTNKDVISYTDATKRCTQVIMYISMWLSSIFLNAKLIIGTLSDVITSDKFGILDAAIRRLGLSTVPLLAVKSLTRALTVIVQMKLPTDDHYLDTVLRSCLSGMMSAILLEKSCRSESIIVAPGWQSMKYIGNDLQWNHSANEYRDFLTLILPPTSIGLSGVLKKVCNRQSGGLCRVLAALCTTDPTQQPPHDFYKMFHLHQKDENKINIIDQIFLKQMAICFSCELTRLAQHFACYRAISIQQFENVLCCLVYALLDIETLILFPTCNLSLLTNLGGRALRSKGEEVLLSSQTCSTRSFERPDEEAMKIEDGNYFDTAGSTYTTQNIWLFCQHVGILMREWDNTEHGIFMEPEKIAWRKSIGHAILNECKELRSNNESLKMLPLVSVERECLKRLMFFRALFAALEEKKEHNFDDIFEREGGLSSIITTSVIENVYFLSEIALYHEQQSEIDGGDDESRYKRAKAYAFQRAYTEFSGSLLTTLLRGNIHWKNKQLCSFVRDHVIVGSLTKNLNIRSTIEEKTRAFNFCLRKIIARSSPSSRILYRLHDDLLLTFLRRAGEIIVHDAGSYGSKEPTALLNSLICAASQAEDAVTNAFATTIGSRLTLTSKAILKLAPCKVSIDKLHDAVDFHLLISEAVCGNGVDEQKSIASLRDWALRIFFPAKLKSPNIESSVKVVILKVLNCMFIFFSSENIDNLDKIFNAGGNLASETITYAGLAYSFKACLCISLVANTVESDFVEALFSCAWSLLKLPISVDSQEEETITLLSWAHSLDRKILTESATFYVCTDSISGYATYIVKFSKWLSECGKLLQDQQTTISLLSILQKKTVSSDALSISQTQTFCSLSDSLEKMEQELFSGKGNIAQNSNRYAKKQTETSGNNGENDVQITDDIFSMCMKPTTSCLQAIMKFEQFAANFT